MSLAPQVVHHNAACRAGLISWFPILVPWSIYDVFIRGEVT